MRSSKKAWLLVLVGLPLVATTACSDLDDDIPVAPIPDSGITPTPGIDAGAPSIPSAAIRVAHLSPDAPTIKVCLVTAGGSFSSTDLPVTPELAYTQIGSYATLPTGAYDVRIVAGTNTDCATPLLPGMANVHVPQLDEGDVITIAAIGKVGDVGARTGANVVFFSDLRERPPAGTTNLRFIHAAPSTPIPVFVGALNLNDNIAAAYFNAVSYGSTAAEYDDSFGYAPLDTSLTRVRLGASDAATGQAEWGSNALAANGLGERTNYTAFAVDNGATADRWQINVLVVDDGAPSTNGLNASAVILPSLSSEIID